MADFKQLNEGTDRLSRMAETLEQATVAFQGSLDRDDWEDVLTSYQRLGKALERVNQQIPSHWGATPLEAVR